MVMKYILPGGGGLVAMKGEIMFGTHTHDMFYQTKLYNPCK